MGETSDPDRLDRTRASRFSTPNTTSVKFDHDAFFANIFLRRTAGVFRPGWLREFRAATGRARHARRRRGQQGHGALRHEPRRLSGRQGAGEGAGVEGGHGTARYQPRRQDFRTADCRADQALGQVATGRTPVRCRVLHNGNPLAGANVVFVPEKFLGGTLKSGAGTTSSTGYAADHLPLCGRHVGAGSLARLLPRGNHQGRRKNAGQLQHGNGPRRGGVQRGPTQRGLDFDLQY